MSVQLYSKILIGMLIGVTLGLVVGPNSAWMSRDAVVLGPQARVTTQPAGDVQVPQAMGITRAAATDRQAGWLHLTWTLTPRDAVRLQAAGVSAHAGEEHRGFVQDDPLHARPYSSTGQRLIDATEWLGRLFLALIKMVVVPLVFFSLIVGIAALGDFRKLGRMGGVTLGYFTLTTVFALIIGLVLANVIAPGDLMSQQDRTMLLGSFDPSSITSHAAEAPAIVDQLVAVVPTNPFSSLANGDMLQVIFFATMLGVALTLLEQDKAQVVVKLCDAVNDVMVVLVHVAMKLAPVGVAALLFQVVGTTGLSVLLALAAYGGVVLLGLLCHILLVYLPLVRLGARMGFVHFIAAIRAPLVLAFSTSSSSATLPVTMRALKDNLKVSHEVASFVLPIGATVNMDGTALYQGVAAIFIAQIYGIDLSLGAQATIVVSATMASIGAAGVPGAGMLTLAMVLAAVGVPVQGIGLVLGVDRVLDMFRTVTNVIGDSTAAVLVARLQGERLGHPS